MLCFLGGMIRMKNSHPTGVCEKSSTEYAHAVDHIISTQKESLSGGEMTETEICKKFCAECKTLTTPLWRCGPTGPKSLCNACGIRFRKKGTVSTLVVNKGSSDKKKEKPSASPASSSTSTIAKTTINGTYETGNDGKNSVHDSYKKEIDEKTSFRKGKDATLDGNLRMRLMGLGKEVVLLRRPRSPMKRQRSVKKLGEVEQAALLLMALSYGSVYA